MNDNNNDSHKELSPAKMKDGEKKVQKIIDSVSGFINPFDGVEDLVSISSGRKLPDSVAITLVSLDSMGSQKAKEFTKQRLIEKKVDFKDAIKRNKIKTFGCLAKTIKITSANNKSISVKAQRNFLGGVLIKAMEAEKQDFGKKGYQVDMKKVMKYQNSPVPWSLATGDGMFTTTSKCTLMKKLYQQHEHDIIEEYEPDSTITSIIDGNALFHSMIGLPETYGEFALKVFKSFPKNANEIHFVTDSYKDDSIKSLERERRGNVETNMTAQASKGPKTKLPRKWKDFLSYDENKQELIAFILREWQDDSYATLLVGKKVYFVNDRECTLLSTENGVHTDFRLVAKLDSTQEEADNRITLHCIFASKK